ncbi:hypothetical conserved protein [Candidatus Nitrosoglobus terrae]|uniref:Hypothetical conserved protein n=2 Tax=Candidatus Nitrosoglobus terrae TaxID=1630141 RepID=A0A1Q2SPX2_9GAMM|nr:hypothetical conserved protein [Candidatus Nitrosoglobus terrae]
MLEALLTDLAENSSVQTVILRDYRLKLPAHIRHYYYIHNLDEFHCRWHDCLEGVDAVLPIAPETEGLLTKIQESVLKADKRLLGCHPEATAIATSKSQTAHCLAVAGLMTLPTTWLQDWQPDNAIADPLICKPDDGVGSTDVLYFDNSTTLNRWKQGKPPEILANRIVQPYLQGIAASLCLLCDKGEALLLCINQQHIQMKAGALYLRGITVNTMAISKIFQEIADRIAHALPKLWGFVGVDLILGPQPIVVEINPRLTTSYLGLRKTYGINPTRWLLTLLDQGIKAVELPPNLGYKMTLITEKQRVICATDRY